MRSSACSCSSRASTWRGFSRSTSAPVLRMRLDQQLAPVRTDGRQLLLSALQQGPGKTLLGVRVRRQLKRRQLLQASPLGGRDFHVDLLTIGSRNSVLPANQSSGTTHGLARSRRRYGSAPRQRSAGCRLRPRRAEDADHCAAHAAPIPGAIDARRLGDRAFDGDRRIGKQAHDRSRRPTLRGRLSVPRSHSAIRYGFSRISRSLSFSVAAALRFATSNQRWACAASARTATAAQKASALISELGPGRADGVDVRRVDLREGAPPRRETAHPPAARGRRRTRCGRLATNSSAKRRTKSQAERFKGGAQAREGPTVNPSAGDLFVQPLLPQIPRVPRRCRAVGCAAPNRSTERASRAQRRVQRARRSTRRPACAPLRHNRDFLQQVEAMRVLFGITGRLEIGVVRQKEAIMSVAPDRVMDQSVPHGIHGLAALAGVFLQRANLRHSADANDKSVDSVADRLPLLGVEEDQRLARREGVEELSSRASWRWRPKTQLLGKGGSRSSGRRSGSPSAISCWARRIIQANGTANVDMAAP